MTHRHFGAALALFGLLAGCGSVLHPRQSGSAAASDDASADAASASLDNYVALGPNDLALKILSAFGRDMTLYAVKGQQVDYLIANGALFTGAISANPYTIIPSALASVPYFMAVEALSEVVAADYNAALAAGTEGVVANDCRQLADAEAIVLITYPQVDAADKASIAQDIVTSCTTDGVQPTVEAIVKSYAFLVKNET